MQNTSQKRPQDAGGITMLDSFANLFTYGDLFSSSSTCSRLIEDFPKMLVMLDTVKLDVSNKHCSTFFFNKMSLTFKQTLGSYMHCLKKPKQKIIS